jgi:glycosyltransferase involved in cell wall biosynthesis
MSTKPLVTAIITTYKRSDFLLIALQSVFVQTYMPLEIIVVDDNNGNDEFRIATKQSLSQYIIEGKIIYVEHEYNKGLSAARNTGIDIAKGIYIAFLDDDDQWLPDKIEVQVKKFEELSEEYGLVYGAYQQVYRETEARKIIEPIYEGDVEHVLGLNHIGPPSMVMCRTDILKKIGCFDPEFRSREDIELYYRLALQYKVAYTNHILINYYIHPNSMSSIHSDKLKYMKLFVAKHNLKLKKPQRRWSEINERLGELYAINGETFNSWRAFLTAFKYNPQKIKLIIKPLILALNNVITAK